MNNVNRIRIARIVNAIFTNGLNEKIKNMTHVPFIPGQFAEQDYRALVSMLYTVRMDIVRIMDGSDRPLQDIPKVGSMDDNDTGRESDMEIERRELLADACECHAILERHLESLAKQAQSDLEEAGKRTQSGGRYVLSTTGRSFKAYCGSWDDFLVDLKQNAKEGTSWMLKIERAQESVAFPYVSAQDATDRFMEYFADENVNKTSERAWEKLMDRFEMLGETLEAHQAETAAFNALPKEAHELAKTEFSVVCREFKQSLKNHAWWLERFMEPWALLCATGAPQVLIDSPEWRTKEAELRAAKARVKLAEVNADMLELEALNAETEAMIALKAARARMALLAKRNEELHEAANPTPKPVKAQLKAAPAAPEVKPAAPKPLASGIHVHSTRGRAASATGPRG